MKNSITSCLLVFVFLLSCNPREKANNTEAGVAFAKSFYTCFNQHDWVKMSGFYADSAVFLDPCYGKEFVLKTRQNIIDRYFVMQKEIPDIKDSIVNIVATSDKIAVEFITIGSLADGTKLKIPMSDIWTIKDGLIMRDASYYDNK